MTDTTETVVETTAPDANVTSEVESVADPSPAADEHSESDAPKSKGVQKRLDELTRNWRETERDRDHWRDLALRNNAPQPKQEAPQEDKLKTLADFEYDDAKFQAYVFEQAEKRSVNAAKRALKEEQELTTKKQRFESYRSKESEFAKTVEDYHDAINSLNAELVQGVAEAIVESDDGPALLYHLAKNREIAAQLAKLSPIAAAKELGRIEARLATERERAKAEKVSKAPPPPPKVEANDPAIDKDPDQMTTEEWVKWREKQISKRRKK